MARPYGGRLSGVWVCAAALFVALSAVGEDPNPPSIYSNHGAWPIRREWNVAETHHFAEWMENIYHMRTEAGDVYQRVAKVDLILTDPAMNLLLDPDFAGRGSNPQLPKSVISYLNAVVDCAKFTQILPSYYAYRRALPWIASSVRPVQGDVRTSPNNIPVGFVNSFTSSSPSAFFHEALPGYSSGNYRVEPGSKNWAWSDTVPVAIDKKYLIPGCVNYVDGHSLLLARVDKYGELHFINASTDSNHSIFTYNGLNAVCGIEPFKPDETDPLKGCFQGLRVWRYPIADTDAKGHVIRVRRRTDTEMEEFGLSWEEYHKIAEIIDTQHIVEDRYKLGSFHELIRYRMKSVDKIVPMEFMTQYVNDMVEMFKARDVFVQDAWHDVLAHGAITYPEEQEKANIFQAFGRWETWSSPSSDVDRRNKYFYLADWMDNAIHWYETMPHLVDLKGFEKYKIKSREDLAAAIITEKNKQFATKSFEYTNSAGKKITLTLADIEKRIYDMSFDPNHSPEIRWGAPEGSEERGTPKCFPTVLPDGSRLPWEEAYRLEKFYRTVCARETEMSCLRGMFTSGFPVRSRFDDQLSKWLSEERRAKLVAKAENVAATPQTASNTVR